MTENSVPTPALATGDARVFLEREGARSNFNLLLGVVVAPDEDRGGICLKGYAWSCGSTVVKVSQLQFIGTTGLF